MASVRSTIDPEGRVVFPEGFLENLDVDVGEPVDIYVRNDDTLVMVKSGSKVGEWGAPNATVNIEPVQGEP